MKRNQIIGLAREIDTHWRRRWDPDLRCVLLNARLPMEYAMMACVHLRMRKDERVNFYFTSPVDAGDRNRIFAEAGDGIRRISPFRAAFMKFDAYLAADFIWTTLPRGTRRVQMFHGVAGKYGNIYDRPAQSVREWDRLFFINQRRLNNFIATGAIDEKSGAARLVGMPKTDCLVDGSLDRNQILSSLGLDPSRPTLIYAPTWTTYSSLNAIGEELVRELVRAGYNLIVKLHDNSLDPNRPVNSGGIDWAGRLKPILSAGTGHLAKQGNISPYLVAADLMISDHSSAAFEYLLLDRPLIRIEMDELIARTNIHPDYVALLVEASTSVRTVAQAIAAVERELADPGRLSAQRKSVAEQLFYKPGTATDRAVRELYELMELSPDD
jgi:CDP-glycerol glycerophosphotransferase (TagB/SpsB family)